MKAAAATFFSPNVVDQTGNLLHLANPNHRQCRMRSVTASQLNRSHAKDSLYRSLVETDVIDIDNFDSIGLTSYNTGLVNESLSR